MKLKKIFSVFAISIFVCSNLIAAGLSFGMTGAVKKKVKELDEKVREIKAEMAQTYTLKGEFASANMSSSMELEISAETVSKAIVFFGNWHNVVSVSNGSFSIEVETGTPVGLIFAGVNDNYLGYLTLKNGIDSIPLTKISDGVDTIDFQILTTSGTSVEPEHNPLGDELPFSAAEQIAIGQCNGMFASVVKNPDVDGNGVIDILENKFYRSFIAYGINAGNFNGVYTPIINSTVTMQFHNVTICSEGTTDSGGATVTGPGITNVTCSESNNSSLIMYSIYSDLGSSPSPIPTSGEYKFTLTNGGEVLTFSIPDQSQASSRIVVAVPTVSRNSNGTINNVNWVYRIPNDSSSNITPTAFIESIMVQINGPGAGDRVYDSPMVTNDITEHTLTKQDIVWTSVYNISMAYNDVYGNHYVVDFRR
ncbi:MAG: hypothetical protein ABIH89_03435 [Elusimicrobiota bacterium]